MSERLSVAFVPREPPLAPVAAAARGEASKALARALLRRSDESLAALRGVAGPRLLLVTGEADALPWVDGVVYLGRDPQAPSLLVPTTHAPDAPPALLERALRSSGARAELGPPLAVLHDPPALVSLETARPIARATLARWLEAAP